MPAAPSSRLWDALDLDSARPPVVAIVGGGGKTALLYRLGREARERGVRAVLAGTTRFTPAPAGEMPPLVEAGGEALPGEVAAALERTGVVVVSAGAEPKGRFGAVSMEAADALARLPGLGLLALEADGSKMRPFKAPAEHEPVIPASATHVVAVVGLDALDAPLDDEHVHRPDRVRAIAGDAERCTAEVIARVLVSPQGGRKAVERRRFAVLVNKADLDPEAGQRLAEAVLAAGVERVVVASLRDDSMPVRSLLVRGEW